MTATVDNVESRNGKDEFGVVMSCESGKVVIERDAFCMGTCSCDGE